MGWIKTFAVMISMVLFVVGCVENFRHSKPKIEQESWICDSGFRVPYPYKGKILCEKNGVVVERRTN